MAAHPSGVSLALLDKLVAALGAKGLVTDRELADHQAIMERASPEIGARMVARAW
jgi:nitrile hydratase